LQQLHLLAAGITVVDAGNIMITLIVKDSTSERKRNVFVVFAVVL